MKRVCLFIAGLVFILVMSISILACVSFPVVERRSYCTINFDASNYKNATAITNILANSQDCQVNSEDIPILKDFIVKGYSVKEHNDEEYANFFNVTLAQNAKESCGEYYIAIHRITKWTGYIKDFKLKNASGSDCPIPNCSSALYTVVWNDLIVNTSNTTSEKKIETLKDYRAAINSSCAWDNDCEIKDVHNCCGASPECVNKNSFVNATLVDELCIKEKATGICGFESINYCKCINKRCKGFLSSEVCPTIIAPNCIAEIVDQGVDDKGCKKTPKCIFRLSNGNDAEIKIMPETASQNAIDRLGELGFNITLKEVGKGDSAKPVYYVIAEKDAKILGFIKSRAKVGVKVDAVSGDFLGKIKPWWSFLAGV